MSITRDEIEVLAQKVVSLTASGKNAAALNVLKPSLDVKCPFTKLDMLGRKIGQAGRDNAKLFETFDTIIEYGAMGGYVIVGQALIEFLPRNFMYVMEKSREYIIKGNVWYVCDIIGERSLGYAVVDYFDKTLSWLEKFLNDECTWVKRSVGVAIHFFSKRVLNQPEKTRMLLNIIEPHIEEKEINVVKGIGWGLKTIGRYHPDILMEFLENQLELEKNISRVMMRKALTYLEKDKKAKIERLLR